MYKDYLKIAFRNIYFNKLNTGINTFGLGLGLACCLLIIIFVKHELSYDKGFENSGRIYRVHYNRSYSNQDTEVYPTTSSLMAPLLKQDFSEIEEVARLSANPSTLSYNDLSVREESVYFADNEVFELFDLEWLAGNASQALVDLSSIVLTQSLATKYFGSEEALGKIITLDNRYLLTVTGVVEDLSDNTHLDFSALIPFDLLKSIFLAEQNFNIDTWRYVGSFTYVMLKSGESVEGIQEQLPDFISRYLPRTEDSEVILNMMPLTDIYMKSVNRDGSTQGSMIQVMSFTLVALAILLISIINYVNISTARSVKRAVEIGVRKTNGATRRQIINQFLVETFILVIIAMTLGVVITELMLPIIDTVTGKELEISYLSEPFFPAVLLVLSIITGLAAGTYPALILSGNETASILRGQISARNGSKLFQNSLVVVQFSIAIILIVCLSVVFSQMQYTSRLNLGFTKDRVINFAFPPTGTFDLNSQWDAFRNQLLSYPGISQVAYSTNTPTLSGGNFHDSFITRDVTEPIELGVVHASPSFFDLYEIEFLVGRNISDLFASDKMRSFVSDGSGPIKGSAIINESAAREFGLSPSEAINQLLDVGSTGSGLQVEVVGVVADTTATAKDENSSLIYWDPTNYNSRFSVSFASVKILESEITQALDHIDATWQTFIPELPVNRWFLEDEIETFYFEEEQQMQLFSYSAGIAVLIACLGLLGLASYNTEQRRKEIGVRKVIGGSVWSIVILLTNDFSKLVLISNIVAWPVSYFAMLSWLQNFAYRIDLSPLFFVGSGVIALCVAWVTVGSIAAKAANTNPVLALRYE